MSESLEYDAFAELVRRMDPQSTLLRTWQLAGGVSAQVTGLEIAREDGTTRKLVARQHGAADRQRNPQIAADEFRLLQVLRDESVGAPAPCFLEDSGAIFDTPCVVMEYIEGEPVFSPDNLDDYLRQFAAQLARIHRIPEDTVSFLPRHSPGFGPRPAVPDDSLSEGLIRDVLEHLWPVPQLNEFVLLHGDFWPGNVLWKEGQLVGVVDWEDAATGEPLADVANSRLEILWAFGTEAMERFTTFYTSHASIRFFYLPFWDLCAALGPASKIGNWGLNADTERTMRDKHQWFVAQALERLIISQD